MVTTRSTCLSTMPKTKSDVAHRQMSDDEDDDGYDGQRMRAIPDADRREEERERRRAGGEGTYDSRGGGGGLPDRVWNERVRSLQNSGFVVDWVLAFG